MAEDKMVNMALWTKYAQPPKEALKAFDNGTFKGTDISPMWRIKCLTEEFGPCGQGWYSELTEHWTETVGEVVMTHVAIKLYVRYPDGWSMPISAVGGNKSLRKKGGVPSDEAYKMAYTDALGGACKMLGIGGAIYWERGYSKYEDDYTGEPASAPTARPATRRNAQQAPKPAPTEETAPAKPYDMLGEGEADTQYRILALTAFTPEQLDASCKRKFQTDFAHTPVSKLREVMPDKMLQDRIDKHNKDKKED